MNQHASLFPLLLAVLALAAVGISWLVGRATKDAPPMTEEDEWDARNG